jgi:hypothetical protein
MKKSAKKEKGLRFDYIFVGLFMVIALAAGGLCLYGGIRDIVMTKLSQNWPGVEGRIISSTIVEEVHWSGKDNRTRSVIYIPEVKYTYTISSQVFTSHRIGFGGSDGPKSDAQKIIARYPVGKNVIVHYSPKDPQKSVLETGGSIKGIIVSFMAGAVFLLIGGILLLFMVINSRLNNRRRRVKLTS